jgi:hypothetical protein
VRKSIQLSHAVKARKDVIDAAGSMIPLLFDGVVFLE